MTTSSARRKKKYGPKASEKVARTLHEWKRGKLKSGSGGKVTSRKQAIAIGLSQARAHGYKVPPASHATMDIDARVRAYLSHMRSDTEIDAYGIARALKVDPLGADYALVRAQKAGLASTEDGKWFAPVRGAAHASKKRAPRVAYWVRSRGGPRSSWDIVPIYVLGTTTRADEGLVGHDLRVRPLRLGKGPYTMVVSPDDVEEKP